MAEPEEVETFAFADLMEKIVTPITVLVGLLGNALSICVLRKKEIQLRKSFARILIALAVFDMTFIAASGLIFSLRALSDTYRDYVYPYTVPVLLPLAQIAMTASVYTTVITCLDRYIAICRPAMLGCCGRSEETTSWGLIVGTVVFSFVYNLSRFFEYEVAWEDVSYVEWHEETNTSYVVNDTQLGVLPTPLRQNVSYIKYYLLLTNFIFMGILPSGIMIIFNVLVVRAVDEANRRRARMTKRQQRNITVTSMLVTVVVVFLICHSVKLIINGYEVYQHISGGVMSGLHPEETNVSATAATSSDGGALATDEGNSTGTAGEEDSQWPLWVEYMTILSHWLLILNSSCNILIYLHKDPKFKAVFWEMILTCFRIPHINHVGGHDDLEDSRMNGGGGGVGPNTAVDPGGPAARRASRAALKAEFNGGGGGGGGGSSSANGKTLSTIARTEEDGEAAQRLLQHAPPQHHVSTNGELNNGELAKKSKSGGPETTL